ncbi:MAG: hypothetical protein FGF53_00210 [Candidatus Brockarchaeota archaeon]|nr:hypothetical protein [Candidatus Brockarchaeota archaeon]MBO3808199.1 hypothetical protein [Candidatus Brockarchaeota archaeon]
MDEVQMSLSRRIIQRVEKYFSKQGFQATDYDEEKGELVFSNGREEALVKILFEEEADRVVLYEALASVLEKAKDYSMVYVAAPRIVGEDAETASFMKKGVGLILYDDYGAEEKVPAENRFRKTVSRQAQRPVETQSLERSLVRIESMIRELSERVDSLEKAYFSLLREVRELRRTVERKTMVAEQPVQKTFSSGGEQAETGGLPSFLKDNPWVEILSKRPEENSEA